MYQKSPNKECVLHKQELPIIQVLKFGRENNTLLNVIYGQLAVYFMKCVNWLILLRVETSHLCIEKSSLVIMIQSHQNILRTCTTWSECASLWMIKWDHQPVNYWKPLFWVEWMPIWISSITKAKSTWLMPSNVLVFLNFWTPNFLNQQQKEMPTRELSIFQLKRITNVLKVKVLK